jgi:endonuclease YncB( thermonuclease family)
VLLAVVIAVGIWLRRHEANPNHTPPTKESRTPAQLPTTDDDTAGTIPTPPTKPTERPAPSPRNKPVPSDFETIKGFASHVKDGDTLVLQQGSKERTIRFWGIDAPEGNTRQPYAEESRALARKLCQRKTVSIIVHDEDSYGRIVGEVVLVDGTNVNLAMIEAGLAWHYEHHARERDDFADAEKAARREGRGLWADEDPVPPWDWRRQHPPQKR